MQKIITIIGGQGQIGKLFAHYWKNIGYIVRILDREDWNQAALLLNDCDLAVISVPINVTLFIINKIVPYLPKHAVLADFTSIKTTVIDKMLKTHKGPVLGLHPMFGPTITSAHKQVIINCGGRPDYQWVLNSLAEIGFNIKDMPAIEHDESMSFIQGIEHFSTFVLGSFLYKHQKHPKHLFDLASPIYQAKLALMGRIFDQDATLYADIITADSGRTKLINEYAKYFQQWADDLNNSDRIISEFEQVSNWMGDFTHKAQLASDQFLTEVSNSFQKQDVK